MSAVGAAAGMRVSGRERGADKPDAAGQSLALVVAAAGNFAVSALERRNRRRPAPLQATV
jgi:hypothetical protein